MLIPIGLAVIGPIASAVGTQTALYATFVMIVVPTLAVLLSREVRTIRRREVPVEG